MCNYIIPHNIGQNKYRSNFYVDKPGKKRYNVIEVIIMVVYTEEQIIKKCEDAMPNIGDFYKEKFINYRGVTGDTKRLYTEVIAEFVIEHIDDFKSKIPPIKRESSYKTASHKGEFDPASNRVEEIIAMKMFNQCKNSTLDHIGTIIDYQTPLKNERKDNAGKIDLISDDGKQLIILELKRPDSDETMLRCVLEGYTYLKTVDKAKLLADFGKPADYGLSASPFVFKGGEQQREMQGACPALRKLMNLLDSKPYYISEKDGEYSVSED